MLEELMLASEKLDRIQAVSVWTAAGWGRLSASREGLRTAARYLRISSDHN